MHESASNPFRRIYLLCLRRLLTLRFVGFLVCANDFDAEFEVRSEKRKESILREYEETGDIFSRFKANGEEEA